MFYTNFFHFFFVSGVTGWSQNICPYGVSGVFKLSIKLFEATGVKQVDFKRAIAGVHLETGSPKTWEVGIIASIEHIFFNGGSELSSVSMSGIANSDSISFSVKAGTVSFCVNDALLLLQISLIFFDDDATVESTNKELLANTK